MSRRAPRGLMLLALAGAAALTACAAPQPLARVETRVLPQGGAVVAVGWDTTSGDDLVLVPDKGVGRVTLRALSADPPAWKVSWTGRSQYALVLYEEDGELALQHVPPTFRWTEDTALDALPGKRWAAFPPRQGNQGGVDLILRVDGELDTVRDWERVYRRVAVE